MNNLIWIYFIGILLGIPIGFVLTKLIKEIKNLKNDERI